MMKKLKRVREGKILAGVCGGIAKYFDIDPKFIRLLFVGVVVAYGSGLLIYLILAIFIPKEHK